MAVDQALIEAHRSFEDHELGITERFVDLEVGGGMTVAVLSTPLGASVPLGWVVCHSFGPDQMELQMTEVALARQIARAGYPVLRFQCQGYGDSELVTTPPTLAGHLRDTADAVAHVRRLTGLREVGLIGGRFGGTVALLVAEQEGLSSVVLMAPATDGKRYLTELLRSRVITDMAEGEGSSTPGEDLRESLASGRDVNVKGFLFTAAMAEEMQGLSLLSRVRGYRGKALLIQVSMSDRPQASIASLATALEGLGADVTSRVVTDRFAARFGVEHMRAIKVDEVIDMLTDLNQALAATVVEWIVANHPDG